MVKYLHFPLLSSVYHLWCWKKGAKKVLKFSHNFHTFLGTKLKKVWKNCEKSHQKPHPPFWEMVLLPKSCEKSVKKSHQKSHQKPHQNHTFQKRTLWYTQAASKICIFCPTRASCGSREPSWCQSGPGTGREKGGSWGPESREGWSVSPPELWAQSDFTLVLVAWFPIWTVQA